MKNNIRRIAITTFIAVFLALLFTFLLLMDIKSNSRAISAIKNDTLALEMQNTHIEHFKKVYPDYKPSLESIGKKFIDPKNPVDVITFLENTAYDCDITLKVSLLAGQDKNQPFIVFELSSSSDYTNILHFLQKLENSPYVLEVKNVVLTQASQETTPKNTPSGKIDAAIILNVFSK